MFIEAREGYSIIVYPTKYWTCELSKSLFASTQMTKKQETFVSQTGLSYHQVEDKHTNGFCLTLTKYGIKYDAIGVP